MKLWTLHSTEAPTGTVAQSTRESQEANDGLISVREPFVATVSVLCSRAAALAARDNELFNWVGKWEKRWNFYDNHIFGSSGKNSLLSKWLMLWFSACFTFLINMSKGGHDLKRSLSSSSLSSSNPWPDLSKILAKRSFFFSSFSSSSPNLLEIAHGVFCVVFGTWPPSALAIFTESIICIYATER